MRPRTLIRLFGTYSILILVACLGLRGWIALGPTAPVRIASCWARGQLVSRSASEKAPTCGPEAKLVVDRIIADGPLPTFSSALFAMSMMAGRDGIAATLNNQTTYLTSDDLLVRRAYRDGFHSGRFRPRIGLDDPDAILDELAASLGTDRTSMLARGTFRRILTQRDGASTDGWPAEREPGTAALRDGLLRATAYMVRNQLPDGHFRYEIDAIQGSENPGYNWPRHGGATLMLAEVAAWTKDPATREAALRSARLLQRSITLDCGSLRCIGDSDVVDGGSSALALLAYSELQNAGITREFDADLRALAAFIRSLQRPDGEFMHRYDRAENRAIDVQLPYYSGEMSLALARAARSTHDPADVEAASAALAKLVRRSLFQNRYNFSTEHWTCQALEELWDRAPNPAALDFCVDHQTFNRMAANPGAGFPHYAGGISLNPFAAPRMAATGSRIEGAVATLATARAAGLSPSVITPLDAQIRRALAFMLRYQLSPGPRHLLADPTLVEGGMPGSPTDLTIRIDYPQHIGGAFLRYLRLTEQTGQPTALVEKL